MESVISSMIKYILKMYPYKSDLSTSRLTKILYLADWKSSIERDQQITNAKWHFNHYGPYVDDFLEIAKTDEDIEITTSTTQFGEKKRQIHLSKHFNKEIPISTENKKIIDFVINATKDKNYEDFIKLVYSTYPVISSSKYSDLDLPEKAKEYKSISSG